MEPDHTVEGENSLVHISLKSQSSKTSRLYQAEISRVKGALAQADGILKNKSLKSRCLLPIFRELKSSCIPCLLAFSFSVNRCTCRRKKGQLYRYRCGLQKRHETDTWGTRKRQGKNTQAYRTSTTQKAYSERKRLSVFSSCSAFVLCSFVFRSLFSRIRIESMSHRSRVARTGFKMDLVHRWALYQCASVVRCECRNKKRELVKEPCATRVKHAKHACESKTREC